MSAANLLKFPVGKISGSISFNVHRRSAAIDPSILWILGLTRFAGDEALVQKAFMELVHRDDVRDMTDAFEDALKQEAVLSMGYRVLDRNETWHRVRFAGFWTRNPGGKIECMVGHLTEVDEDDMAPAEEIFNNALRIRELSVENRFLPLAHMSDLMLRHLQDMARANPERGLF